MFREVRKLSLSAQIAQQLRSMILNGKIAPGTKLPSEKELASQFGTNRNTLREGIRILEEEGLVDVRQGGGMMVLDWRKHGGIGLLPHMLTLLEDPGLKYEVLVDALKVRRMALGLVARAAAENAEEENISQIDEAINRARKSMDQENEAIEADINFYEALVGATKSMVLLWFTNTVMSITRKIATQAPGLWITEQGYIDGLVQIRDAVAARNPEEAEKKVVQHLTRTDNVVTTILKGGF